MAREVDVREVLPKHPNARRSSCAGPTRRRSISGIHATSPSTSPRPRTSSFPRVGTCRRRRRRRGPRRDRGVPDRFRPRPVADRVLATVLFTDIVGSTERAATLGDRRWRELLERHDALVRREIERFRGREVARGRRLARNLRRTGASDPCAPRSATASTLGIADPGRCAHRRVRESRRRFGGRGDPSVRASLTSSPGEVLVSRTVRDLIVGTVSDRTIAASTSSRACPALATLRRGAVRDAPPKTRYALTQEGELQIAYQVVGDGPLDLVYAPGWVTNLERAGRSRIARSCHRLASLSRLILFDCRGTGLSDWAARALQHSRSVDGVRMVMDAVGSGAPRSLRRLPSAPMSVLFAATYPERTVAVMIFGAFATEVAQPTIHGRLPPKNQASTRCRTSSAAGATRWTCRALRA